MKNLKGLTIIVIIGLLSLITSSVFATNTAKVNSETARMRSKANTKASIVTLISMNEEVTVLEEKGDWCKIKYNGKTGYISKSLLDMKKSTATTKEDKSKNTVVQQDNDFNKSAKTNTTNNVQSESANEDKEQNQAKEPDSSEQKNSVTENFQGKLTANIELRILPLINSTKISDLEKDTDIKVLEIVNNWCSVQTDTVYGWVLKSKLETSLSVNQTQSNIDSNNKDTDEESTDTTEKKTEEQDDTVENSEQESSVTKKRYVNVDTVNVRKAKSTSSEIVTSLGKNAEVEVLEEKDNWSKVKINGKTGFIASKYLSDKKEEVTSRGGDESRQPNTESIKSGLDNSNTSENSSSNKPVANTSNTGSTSNTNQAIKSNTNSNPVSSNKGTDVVNYAKQYLGCKYVLGGMSPTKGFDCSGFTSYVYKHFGKTLSRTSSGQRSNGTAVSKSNLQQGDIVCFSGHVGIYIGGNKFIHASNPSDGVKITSLSDSYYVKKYITARRIF